jgi:hypothetical protein
VVDVIARERPHSTDPEDGNWLQASVQVHVDGPGSVNRLVFRLDVDQTHLPPVLAGLDDVVTRFRAR